MLVSACLKKFAAAALAVLAIGGLIPQPASAGGTAHRIPTQYIAALGAADAKSGDNAATWGLWDVDPGPRGVRLSGYEALRAAGGIAPASWKFEGSNWWLDEHGLIMEQPKFPMPPGQYIVTGGRDKMAVLTVHPKGGDGLMHWELSDGANIYDVTHLRCRAALYTPAAGANSCTPAKVQVAEFPVTPGGPMPPVEGCNKQDFQVLIVIGMIDP